MLWKFQVTELMRIIVPVTVLYLLAAHFSLTQTLQKKKKETNVAFRRIEPVSLSQRNPLRIAHSDILRQKMHCIPHVALFLMPINFALL